jgi:WD40 repeat protein
MLRWWSGRENSSRRRWDEARLLSGEARGLHAVAWSHDGQRLATGNADRTVQVWELSGDSVTLKGHAKAVTAVGWEQAESWEHAAAGTAPRVASASWDGTVRVWQQEEGLWKCRGLLRASPNNDPVRAVSWRPSRARQTAANAIGYAYDAAQLASAGADGTPI